jgi:hypothetical protein
MSPYAVSQQDFRSATKCAVKRYTTGSLLDNAATATLVVYIVLSLSLPSCCKFRLRLDGTVKEYELLCLETLSLSLCCGSAMTNIAYVLDQLLRFI